MKKLSKKQIAKAQKIVQHAGQLSGLGSTTSSAHKITFYTNTLYPGLYIKSESLRQVGEDLGFVTEWSVIHEDGTLQDNPEQDYASGTARIEFLKNMVEKEV